MWDEVPLGGPAKRAGFGNYCNGFLKGERNKGSDALMAELLEYEVT